MKEHKYRITVEHIADADGCDPGDPPMVFEAANHDDIFRIVRLAEESGGAAARDAKPLFVGLKLFADVVMKRRAEAPFDALKPLIGETVRTLKAVIKGARAPERPSPAGISSLDHIVLTVSDIDRALGFYCGALGMEEVRFGEGRVAVKFGRQKINLHAAGSGISPRAANPVPGSADICLVASRPLGSIAALLRGKGIETELGPVARTGAAGMLTSIYVRDPDGNLIEISNRA